MDVALALAEQVGLHQCRRCFDLSKVDYPSLGYMAYNDVEPANGNIWELWDSPTGSDGMDSV
jgi:hypothetical protein